jgi:UDP-N-acetylmuramate dehydrogenase
MNRHVSWRAGGVAERAYFPADLSDLRVFLSALNSDESVHFVGLGSNLLVRDGGVRGTVIFTHRALSSITLDAAIGEIRADAGVASPKVARLCAMHDFVGAEFLAGIPGTIGGALAMNAGCYGGETWNIVRQVEVIDRSGRVYTRTPAQYAIAYRSVVKRSGPHAAEPSRPVDECRMALDEWFVSAVLALPRGDGAASREQMKALLSRRIASQPLGLPNAGSVFRNPDGAYAAKLIEDCGLKGHAIGGAVISTKHANFIVNTGAASAADIEALIELAQHTVQKKFGVDLEREIRIVGDKANAAGEKTQARTHTRPGGGVN